MWPRLPLLFVLSLLACEDGVFTITPPVEDACDDGIDNDDDGAIDCDDDDCDGAVECTWPTTLTVEGRFEFEASLLGQLGGAQDCTLHYTSPQTRERPSECAACDRTYHGPFAYLTDDCPPDAERPTEGSYGLVFSAETRWQAWFRDTDGAWTMMGVANLSGDGSYVFTTTDPVIVQNAEVGEIYTTYRFTPP